MGERAVPTQPASLSLSRQIYATLRERIIRGHYPQGTRLVEQPLADELNVSRVPLREAVPLLEIDGFVQSLPRRGVVVTTWTRKDAQDLFDLRLCLEVGAARYAAEQIDEGASIARLSEALQQSREGVLSGDPYRVAADSTNFHEVIVELTDNALMGSLMRSLSGRMMWLFFLTSELDPIDALHGHQELLEAITSGNPRLAESVAYAHIESDRIDSLKAMRHLADPGVDGAA